MGPGGRDRACRAHGALGVDVEIRARQDGGRPPRTLLRAALLPSLCQHDRAFARPDAAGTALLRRLYRPCGEALLERGELLSHRGAREHLRVGGRITLLPFPVVYRFSRGLERLDKRESVAQRLVVKRLAEPGVVAVVIAAAGGARSGGGRDDRGVA